MSSLPHVLAGSPKNESAEFTLSGLDDMNRSGGGGGQKILSSGSAPAPGSGVEQLVSGGDANAHPQGSNTATTTTTRGTSGSGSPQQTNITATIAPHQNAQLLGGNHNDNQPVLEYNQALDNNMMNPSRSGATSPVFLPPGTSGLQADNIVGGIDVQSNQSNGSGAGSDKVRSIASLIAEQNRRLAEQNMKLLETAMFNVQQEQQKNLLQPPNANVPVFGSNIPSSIQGSVIHSPNPFNHASPVTQQYLSAAGALGGMPQSMYAAAGGIVSPAAAAMSPVGAFSPRSSTVLNNGAGNGTLGVPPHQGGNAAANSQLQMLQELSSGTLNIAGGAGRMAMTPNGAQGLLSPIEVMSPGSMSPVSGPTVLPPGALGAAPAAPGLGGPQGVGNTSVNNNQGGHQGGLSGAVVGNGGANGGGNSGTSGGGSNNIIGYGTINMPSGLNQVPVPVGGHIAALAAQKIGTSASAGQQQDNTNLMEALLQQHNQALQNNTMIMSPVGLPPQLSPLPTINVHPSSDIQNLQNLGRALSPHPSPHAGPSSTSTSLNAGTSTTAGTSLNVVQQEPNQQMNNKKIVLSAGLMHTSGGFHVPLVRPADVKTPEDHVRLITVSEYRQFLKQCRNMQKQMPQKFMKLHLPEDLEGDANTIVRVNTLEDVSAAYGGDLNMMGTMHRSTSLRDAAGAAAMGGHICSANSGAPVTAKTSSKVDHAGHGAMLLTSSSGGAGPGGHVNPSNPYQMNIHQGGATSLHKSTSSNGSLSKSNSKQAPGGPLAQGQPYNQSGSSNGYHPNPRGGENNRSYHGGSGARGAGFYSELSGGGSGHQKGGGKNSSYQEKDNRTTMMLRNIPNKYTQPMLLNTLDEQGFQGKFDFFYLPIDFRNRCNVGYAFINFTSPDDAKNFLSIFHKFKLKAYNSPKVCEVNYARVQGLQANIEVYRNSPVNGIPIKQYRPLIFRNGVELDFPSPDAPLPPIQLRSEDLEQRPGGLPSGVVVQ
ncbi:unnamed protein product [Amoebophrya sp. A25]|nr:unnamed protein product [Amoebophrya sp. A25]|eukprot:GSA25T00008623001.1